MQVVEVAEAAGAEVEGSRLAISGLDVTLGRPPRSSARCSENLSPPRAVVDLLPAA